MSDSPLLLKRRTGEGLTYQAPVVAEAHPPGIPQVRDFHACIGQEARRQCEAKWGGKPDVLVACVGGGSNAIGLFHEFVDDEDIRLIGVEAAGFGTGTNKHAATLTMGTPGVLHGSMSYLLQDADGQVKHDAACCVLCVSAPPAWHTPTVPREARREPLCRCSSAGG